MCARLLYDLARAVPDAAVLLVFPSPCTVSRPRTMSSGYVALMPTMPAPAPAASRSSGVICPSPPLSCRCREMALRAAACQVEG